MLARKLTGTALAACLALIAFAGAAEASSIVYTKGGDIWLASPDGKRKLRLTNAGGFQSPSQDDRGRIWAIRKGQFVRLDRRGRRLGRPFRAHVGRSGNVTAFGPWEAQVSPNGRRIAYWRGIQRLGAPLGGETPYELEDQLVVSRSDRFTPHDVFGYMRDYRDPSWVNNDELLMFNYGLHVAQAAFFMPQPAGEPSWGEWFSERDASQIGEGELSRDGHKLVALAGNGLGLVNIGIYRALREPERVCSFHSPDGSTEYADPSFAPGGDAVAFAQDANGRRSDGVWTIPVGGLSSSQDCLGRARLIARGAEEPDWGPADL